MGLLWVFLEIFLPLAIIYPMHFEFSLLRRYSIEKRLPPWPPNAKFSSGIIIIYIRILTEQCAVTP